MAEAPKAWMPLFIGDYLADTAHLTTAQHGAYILLIMHYWRTGKPLPDDEHQLCMITRMQMREWSKNRAVILSFFERANGVYVHHRVEHELSSAIERKQKNKVRAEAAAGARWRKSSDAQSMLVACSEHAPSNDQALLEECPSPSPIHKTKRVNNPPIVPPRGDVSDGFAAFWQAYPRKVGKGQAEKAYAKALKAADHETIMAACQRYAAERAGQDQQYTRNPATWLNGQGWLDEPAAPQTTRGQHEQPIDREEQRRAAARERDRADRLTVLRTLGLVADGVDDHGPPADWGDGITIDGDT